VKRWNSTVGDEDERPEVDAFLAEIAEVCRRHKLTLSHEDRHGAFEVIPREPTEHDTCWLTEAHYAPPAEEPEFADDRE